MADSPDRDSPGPEPSRASKTPVQTLWLREQASLFGHAILADTRVICGNQMLPAHRAILLPHSALWQRSPLGNEGILDLHMPEGARIPDLAEVLRFCYSATVPFARIEDVADAREAVLEIHRLYRLCDLASRQELPALLEFLKSKYWELMGAVVDTRDRAFHRSVVRATHEELFRGRLRGNARLDPLRDLARELWVEKVDRHELAWAGPEEV